MSEHWLSFKLPDKFVEGYQDIKPPFGFSGEGGRGGLGELVFYRTYSRLKGSTKETYTDVIRRCVEGTYTLQKDHILSHHLGWNEEKGIHSAERMFDHMFHMRFLPAGRGLWMMGTEYAHTRTTMGLFNCAFVCTENIAQDLERPFTYLMDVSMLGVGCGFNTLGAGRIHINDNKSYVVKHQIPDSREGWVDSTGLLIRSYFDAMSSRYEFDYSKIRELGSRINGFGGVSSGPAPLIKLHTQIKVLFDTRIEQGRTVVDSRLITDIMNMMGECVVAGNVRRSAELALGHHEDEEFLDLKNYDVNPERKNFGRFSNNSIYARVGMHYPRIAERTISNGEPGYIWLDNIQAYGRMGDPPNYKDINAKGCNPCVEQSLESYEVCNLVEIFPPNIQDHEEFMEVVKCAYLYGKSVTLVTTHREDTNRVQLKNRRIGLSLSGIALFREQRGMNELIEWMDSGYKKVQYYDEVYSKWLAIPRSIKTTSVKPSGTISLVAGTTAGVHYPENRYYLKNIRVASDSPIIKWAEDSGYVVEPETIFVENESGKWTPSESTSTSVIAIPVKFDIPIRSRADVTMWEQLKLVEIVQKYWADNQVSSTVTFQPEERQDVARALEMFDRDMKNVSFFQYCDSSYPQTPEQRIEEEDYEKYVKKILIRDLHEYLNEDALGEAGCTNEGCAV